MPVDQATGTADGPRVADALVGYVFAIGLSSVSAAIAIAQGADEDGIVVLLASQVGFWTGLVTTTVLAVRWRVGTRIGPVLGLRLERRDVVVGLPLGLAAQLVVVPLLYLPLQYLVDDLDVDGPARDLLDRATGAGLLALAVSVVVVAPLVEELFFRGLLLRSMEARWGPRVAWIGSSVVFGATHFQLLQFPALALAGALFAGLALRFGRLGPAVLAHVGFNLATVVVLTATG